MLFLRLVAYVLWIPGMFAIISAVILPLVGARLSRRGLAAAPWPQLSCAEVRAGPQPVHVHGASAPGPPGTLHARLSGTECVWYRERLIRRYLVTRIRYSDDWMEAEELVEAQIWAWDSGPFTLRDESGSVLVAPPLLDRTINAAGHPVVRVVDEIRDEGGEPSRYQNGALGALLRHSPVPPGLLGRYADPAARTSGYRVVEDILRPGLPFSVFAVPGERGGEPILATPFRDVWAISVQPMPVTLASGGKRAKAMGVWFGVAGLAFFAVSAVVLLAAG